MQADEMFDRSAAHRRELADWLETLSQEQLATPSWCAPWDVRTVVAHLTVLVAVPLRTVALAMVRHAGNFGRANDALARSAARQPVDAIATTLRRRAASRAVPPVGGARAPLTDLLVHGADARLPLGAPWDPPVDEVATALGFVSGGALGFVPRGRLRGIRLVAEDVGEAYGDPSGVELRGRGIDLLLAACGRAAALPRLSPPSAVTLLSGRLTG